MRGALPNNLRFILMASCAATSAACAPEPPLTDHADLVFRGGAVYTMDAARPWATAVVVDEGRIVYVGDDEAAGAWIGEETEIVEIEDGMLMPGFIDSHMHPMAAGARYLQCPLEQLAWPDEVLATLKSCADALAEGAWLRASGLDSGLLEGEGPGIETLDAVTGDHPALITANLGDPIWLNSAALVLAGIDPASSEPQIEGIVRDATTGAPTGVFHGEAIDLVWPLSSHYSEEELRQGLRRASRLANGFGITTVNEASARAEHWSAYRAADAAGEMTLRVNISMRWDPAAGEEQIRSMLALLAEPEGQRTRFDSIKLFLDGSGEKTASVLEPYPDSEHHGHSYFGGDLDRIVQRLDASGFNLHLHAYGDRAVRDGLDAIARAMEASPPRERRHRLSHVALVHPDDLPHFSQLGVTADIQPQWAWMSAERQLECESLGKKRCRHLLAFRDLFDSGARVVAGSDWPSESMNPLYAIQVAITRRPPDGDGPSWNPEQRVTLEEMLRAYTIDGARLTGQADLTGSIEVGKSADLVFLQRNLFAIDPMAIRAVPVLQTLLEGRVVYIYADP